MRTLRGSQRKNAAKRNLASFIKSREREWEELRERYLPISSEGSVWRSNRQPTGDDLGQGWKIHISATILSASRVMRKCAPFLSRTGVMFKAPCDLHELSKINSGLHYGFSQVGKFLTVYPRNDEEALFLARKLHQLTYRLPGPVIPYDNRFRQNSPTYYRYGGFSVVEIENPDGTTTPAIRSPKGDLVADRRELGAAVPAWTTDPFSNGRYRRTPAVSPLRTTIRAYEALSQRGKGGVYRALDFSVIPARICILKEGRKHGETGWDARDGCDRIRHEKDVLLSLRAADVCVPAVYMSFEAGGNYYLVTEFIEGSNLNSLLLKRHRLSLLRAIQYARGITDLLASIHAAGWAWRDCKPRNLLLSQDATLRPVDFEAACRVDDPEFMPWATREYAPARFFDGRADGSQITQDLYALGATIYHLLCGYPPEKMPYLKPLGVARRNIPRPLRDIVAALLDPDPTSRPSLKSVRYALKSITEFGDL